MKIAYVYDAVYPWETGGVQKRVWELARRLATNHDVHWYGLHYWDGPRTIEREGVTLHGVSNRTDLYTGNRRSIPEALEFSARLVPALLREDFDVIDCQQFPYFPAFTSKVHAIARHTPLVVTWHEVWNSYWYEYLGWKGVFGKAVEKLTAGLADTNIAVSEQTSQQLRAVSGHPPTVVPNGIDVEEIEAAATSDRKPDVAFVGRLIPEKNPTMVVEAIARLRETESDIQCVILGEGPELEAVERAIDSLGVKSNITLVPPRDDYGDVLALMKAATVFVLPSRREGFGMTILESLACGTPVVTIQHPQNAGQELVDDGVTGVICPETPTGLANGIQRARSLSRAACTDAAAEYDWSRLVEQIESVYVDATIRD